MKQVEAVILDIDGTLTPTLSWLSITDHLGASTERHIEIYQDYRAGKTDYKSSKQTLLQLWQETGNATKGNFESLFRQLPFFASASTVVEELRKAYKLCLISGSVDVYVASVAQRLHIPDYFANTTLHWGTDGKLVDMDYQLDQASKKLEQFLGYCATNHLDPSQCVVVGDSENDVELFKVTGRGIAVGHAIPEALQTVAWKSVGDIAELPEAIKT